MTETADILVIGAGIAGASAAALLAEDRDVILLEAEDRPGYHTTGRSAATWIQYYGPPQVRAMTRASWSFLNAPPEGFCDGPLMKRRGEMLIGEKGQDDLLRAEIDNAPGMQWLSPEEAKALIPALKADLIAGAAYDADAQDIDVDMLHQGYLRLFKRRGGRLFCDARVTGIEKSDGGWTVTAGGSTYQARILVNAAGAWGDVVAELAGVKPVGLVPKRRTAAMVTMAGDPDTRDWPLCAAVDMSFYIRPDGGRLMVSPADETPSEPCDAFADDYDVAVGIDRMQTFTDLEVTRVENSWAGLRTFAPDGVLVNGFDPEDEGFYWLVGQGGYGIQTAPAMAQFAAAAITGKSMPQEHVDAGVNSAEISPARFRG
ncbi:NAD(P)/FAD-dependent oxidoreductase [Hwanghaeella sp.]|uniref:NAD(P)/FAD-dependent oxidoreductase n=1 Tax=Hwanghaeella sp. TaxID=2605943 RepID=UPI003CCBCBA0